MSVECPFRVSTTSEQSENPKNLDLESLKINGQILKKLLLWRAVLTPDLGRPNSSTWIAATHPSIKESTKGGGAKRGSFHGWLRCFGGGSRRGRNICKCCKSRACMYTLQATSARFPNKASRGWKYLVDSLLPTASRYKCCKMFLTASR